MVVALRWIVGRSQPDSLATAPAASVRGLAIPGTPSPAVASVASALAHRRSRVRALLSRLGPWAAPLCLSCGPSPLTVDMPLHLEDHLEVATITGSGLPANPPQAVEWRFDQPQPGWQATPAWNPPFGAVTLTRTAEGLRVDLGAGSKIPDGRLRGFMHVDVPDWNRGEWAEVMIRARADSATSIQFIGIGFNRREGRGSTDSIRAPLLTFGQQTPIVRDGTVQTYRLRVSFGPAFQGAWRQLFLQFGSPGEPGSIELLSVSVVPTAALYADSARGVRPVTIGERLHRALFTHTPASIRYRVRVPAGGRLDVGLGVVSSTEPVTFSIMATRRGGQVDTILSRRHAHSDAWAAAGVDLSRYAGETITLTLAAQADQPGSVALWAAPTVSGARTTSKPNVILYVIDTGGADYMSVYGYHRRTTPFLEQLASEGVVFEHAYSTSSWTKPSTASFMTSLHASVLGLTDDRSPVPPQALTMAQRLHGAGYQTAVFTANPNASTVSGLERGADLVPGFPIQNDAQSSVKLHQAFWGWREAAPGAPFWAHFQTTDVHAVSREHLRLFDGIPVAPFGGLFVSPEELDSLREWSRRVQAGGGRLRSTAFADGSVDRVAYHALLQGMWDQQMAHNDYQLRRLVDQLKASGEWANTLLIVTADHSIGGAFTDTRIGMLDSMPPTWTGTLLRPTISRVPLIVVWPGQLAAGRRFADPVSLIDLLPTVLDLVGLPRPAVLQGQSLAPLLRGQPGWTPRPVILEEVNLDRRSGQLAGTLEVVEGQWGASLWIGPVPADTSRHRPWPLLLYDLWNDPLAVRPVNVGHPDLVSKYTQFLEAQWQAHQALATRFKAGAPIALSPEQLERLRALGYIR